MRSLLAREHSAIDAFSLAMLRTISQYVSGTGPFAQLIIPRNICDLWNEHVTSQFSQRHKFQKERNPETRYRSEKESYNL